MQLKEIKLKSMEFCFIILTNVKKIWVYCNRNTTYVYFLVAEQICLAFAKLSTYTTKYISI